jgi:hypothetical protein
VVLGSAIAVLASPLAIGSSTAATPTAIALNPSAAVTTPIGVCKAFTISSNGGAGAAVTVTATETPTASQAANPLSLYDGTCTTPVPAGNVTNTGTGAGPFTASESLTLDGSGQGSFGVLSSATGAGNVNVSASAAVSAQTAIAWTASGADAVKTLTSNPTSTTQNTGTTASFAVTATDTNSNPIPGVQVFEETTSAAAPDQIANTTSCGNTDATGKVTCAVHNGGNAGTDPLTFWVNNSAGTTHTQGPDNGEPQTNATAVFQAGPPVNAANSSVTCIQQLAGNNQNTAQANCTLPLTQKSVTFTALVEDASHNPLSGVTVNFAATAAKIGGATLTGTNLPSGTGTTNASGQATFVVNNPTPAAGDNVTMGASVGGTSIGSATATWAASHATALNVVPTLQSVAKGGTVNVTAQVVDQFGTALATQPTLTYLVTGRNLGKAGTVPANGTITYTDAGTVASSNTDTITVNDATDSLSGSATVVYVTSATASAVTIDTSGSGTTDASCGASGHTAATGVASGTATEVCAVVKNSAGEPLAGKTVTFTVSNGQVAAHGALGTSSGTSYAATTDAAGVAFADVTSTKSGAQTVTATSDAATANSTVTYAGPTPAQAYKIAVAPATATIAPSSSQKFVATVTDKNGNPVPGVTVVFTQTGAGTVGNGNTAITASDGTVNVTVTTSATDSGAGTVTFNIGNSPTVANQCATTGGVCSATANYTVAQTGASTLTLSASSPKVGGTVSVSAIAKKADGTPAAGQVVRFFVSGAQTINNQPVTTDSNGQAIYRFTATKAGNLTISAYVDTNNDQVREANEPKATTQTVVSAARAVEHPTIFLTSAAKGRTHGTVTVHVATRPNAHGALVRYYVKRNGVWHQIGTNTVRRGGHATFTALERKGQTLRFKVTVARTARTTFGSSAPSSITVR